MIRVILNIRFKQISRLIIELGILRALILAPVVFFMGFTIFRWLENDFAPILLSVVLMLSLASIHSQRRDRKFLISISQNTSPVYFSEYLLFSLPWLIMLLFTTSWWLALAMVPLIFILSITHIPVIFKSRRRKTFNWISAALPEWHSGWREHKSTLFFFLVLGLAAAYFVITVPLVICLLGFIITSFFSQAEGKEMLLATGETPRQVLRNKIRLQWLHFFVLTLPLVITFLILHLEYWFIVLYIELAWALLFAVVIYMKYSFFEAGSPLNKAMFNLIIGICFISFFIPFLLPLPILFLLRYQRRSRENLARYLYDPN